MIAAPRGGGSFAGLAALRAAVSAVVLFVGFRAVSDDDYARVVIAQTWARAPKLDPSGTSWLPFPFWLNGAAMLAFGRSLFVAQAVAFVLGIASTLVVALGALRITGDRRAAFLAGAFVTLTGWSAWLGVATVPEGFTAALTFFAAASLTTTSLRLRFLGALALVAATLSRYEPWPVACAFAAWNAIDLHLRWRPGVSSRVRAALVANVISATALVGSAAWIAWNHFTRGDAFDFVARVTAYRRALGEGADESILARLIAYPIALAKELPEIAVPFAVALLLAAVPRLRPAIVGRLRRHAAPLSLGAVQVVALAVALVKDGAPTHHPERAVLFPALAMAVFVADVAVGLAPKLPRALVYVAGAALFVRAAAVPLTSRGSFAQRESEVAMGHVVANKTRPEAKILIEVTDYGYFAILASSGRPERFELDRDLDPRHPIVPPVFDDDADYITWLRKRGVDYIIGPRDESTPVELRFEGSITYPTKRHRISQVPRE